MLSGQATRCVRSPGNRAPQGDNDPKADQRAARTSAMTREVRAAILASVRLADPPHGRRWKAHQLASFYKTLAVSRASGIPHAVNDQKTIVPRVLDQIHCTKVLRSATLR